MNWILLALAAPLLWAGSNIFDKYALEKLSRGNYDFLFFGTIGSFLISFFSLLVFGLDYIGVLALYPLIGGFLLQYSYLFYSYALEKEDASYVTPLYVTYSVVVLILSPLFGEVVTLIQVVSFGIVFIGAVLLSLKRLSLQFGKFRKGALFMIPAVVLVSIYVLFIDHSLENISFLDTFIYDLLGFSLGGVSLFLIPKWRREIITGIQKATRKKYSLFFINDMMDMSGHIAYKYALLLAPSVSLVAVLGGIQPFYVLILGFIFTKFFPKVVKENISKREILQKVVGATIIAIGIVFLNVYQ